MANYLYNGVELPALPELDRETYPYAVLSIYTESDEIKWRMLVCFSVQPYVYDSFLHQRFKANAVCSAIEYFFNEEDGAETWEIRNEGEYIGVPAGDALPASHYPIWANFDLYREDGTIMVQASDPVPVLTGDPVYQQSMLVGWLTGRAVRTKKCCTAVLDNDWPVEWNSLAVKDNAPMVYDIGDALRLELVKVSDATPSAEELERITAQLTAGDAVYGLTYHGGGQTDARLYRAQYMNGENTVQLWLFVATQAGKIGDVFVRSPGLYAQKFAENVHVKLELAEADEPGGEIVGYLYNGVQLHDFNIPRQNCIEAEFPFATIVKGRVSMYEEPYYLILSTAKLEVLRVEADDYTETYLNDNIPADAGYVIWRYYEEPNSYGNHWLNPSSGLMWEDLDTYDNIVWANYDVECHVDSDISGVYLAASEPVPVYA